MRTRRPLAGTRVGEDGVEQRDVVGGDPEAGEGGLDLWEFCVFWGVGIGWLILGQAYADIVGGRWVG